MAQVLQQRKAATQQIPPLSAKLREARALIRPVSQVNLRLRAIPGRDRFHETVGKVLPWLNKRAGRPLPKEAWQHHSFEISEIGAQRTAAIALEKPRYWAARLDYSCGEVASRIWTTEVGVGVLEDGDVLFGTRLVCSARSADTAIERTIPGFVKAVMATGQVELDNIELQTTPRLLSTESDVLGLVDLLEHPGRQGDVVVFSLPEGSTNHEETIIPAQSIHESIRSVAHVFIVSGPASYLLTDAVGRELSVFRQAVRIYRPGFLSWVAQPRNHPLALQSRVGDWDNKGPSAFSTWLVDQVLASSVRPHGREDRLPSFNSVRQWAAQIERQQLRDAGGSDAEMIELYEEDNHRLRKELQELEDLYSQQLQMLTSEREAAIQEANTAKTLSFQRAQRIRQLGDKLAKLDGKRVTPIPDSLEEFEAWCTDNLPGSVEVMGRARQAVRKSGYFDPAFIYRSLLLLRDQYVPMRIDGTRERHTEYQLALQELQLEDAPTGDGIKYASDTYSVQYGGIRKQLDRHLKGSNSRDRRFGFRLYFFWNDEDQVAVVGWLPTHLDSKLT